MTRPSLLLFCLAAWMGAPAARADVPGLPVEADRCAIAYALTGRALPGCRLPDLPTAPTRSAGGEAGYFVQFEFDSGRLTPVAQAHLARLSDLLNDRLSGLCVRLVGHTDTVGAALYNQALSTRRARAARLYMAGPGRVDASRLSVQGRGEAAPLPGIPGTDGRNRRVEILARESAGTSCS